MKLLGIIWSVVLLLIPFVLPFLSSTSTKHRLMISISWFLPWAVLRLFWIYSGPDKGVGNLFYELASAVVICSFLSAVLFSLRSKIEKFYPYGFLLGSTLVFGVSAITPFIGK